MRDWFRGFALWIATGFRAAPLLTGGSIAFGLIQGLIAPLQAYGLKLVVDGLTRHERATTVTAVAVLAVTFGGSYLLASLEQPLLTTVIDKAGGFLHTDLIRIITGIPAVVHHEQARFVRNRVALQHAGQRFTRDRLLEAIDDAEHFAFVFLRGHADQHDRDVTQRSVRLEFVQRFNAALAWHHDVERDQIGAKLAGHRQAFIRARRGDDLAVEPSHAAWRPERLRERLLRGEAGCARLDREAAFRFRQQPLLDAGATLDHGLVAGDDAQIGADADDHGPRLGPGGPRLRLPGNRLPGYSTVTDLARLRG